MKKQAVKIVSWLMLVIFLLGVMPKEYLHDALFHHHDTVDPVLKKGEVVISNKHIHCSFLGFVFGPFIATEPQTIVFSSVVFSYHYVAPIYCYHYCNEHKVVSLRGPPAAC